MLRQLAVWLRPALSIRSVATRSELALVSPEDSLEDRQRRGYGISIQEPADVMAGGEFVESRPSGPPGYETALNGQDGCSTTASSFQTSIAALIEGYQPEFASVWERYLGDESIRDAETDWRECMADHGYTAETSFDMQEQIATSANTVDGDKP